MVGSGKKLVAVSAGGQDETVPTTATFSSLPFSLSTGQPSPAVKKSNCFSLDSFLADKHVKIDVSVIFTISGVAAKEPAGPCVGIDVVSVYLLFFH